MADLNPAPRLLVEVKGIRLCEGGYSCTVNANNKRACFIAPGIVEWASYSKKVDVLSWFAKTKCASVLRKPVVLSVSTENPWESIIPDHKLEEAKTQEVERYFLRWVIFHFIAWDAFQRYKMVEMTVNTSGVPTLLGGWEEADPAEERVPLSSLSLAGFVRLIEKAHPFTTNS